MESYNQRKLNIIRDKVGKEVFYEIWALLVSENVRFGSLKEMRNEKIKEDFYNGATPAELADKYNLSVQSIYKITERKF